jgi:hypothetical protein
MAVSLLRVEDRSGLTATVDAVQRRAIIPFADAAQRADQLANPPPGTVTFRADGGAFEWWNGTTWLALAGDTSALAARVDALETRMTAVESKNTTQDNRLTTLEARLPGPIAAGYSVVATDANALATITHNLGVIPRAVLCMLQNQTSPNGPSAVNDWCLFNTGANAVAINVRLGDSHGDQYVNRSGIGVYWVAIG